MDADGVDRLFRDWRAGGTSALDKLVPIICGGLRRLARGQLRRDPAARSIQPIVLGQEAFSFSAREWPRSPTCGGTIVP